MWWKICWECFRVSVLYRIRNQADFTPSPKTVTQFFHFHFQFHRAKILDYSWLFCFLTGYSSSWQTVWVLFPQILSDSSSSIFDHTTSLRNPTVVPIAGFKSSLETLPVLSTSSQEDLPFPFLFLSPDFTHPFPPFRIRPSLFLWFHSEGLPPVLQYRVVCHLEHAVQYSKC